jgi:hypothetical protein
MSFKKKIKPEEVQQASTIDSNVDSNGFNYEQQQAEILGVDSSTTVAPDTNDTEKATVDVQELIQKLTAKAMADEQKKQQNNAMGAVPLEEYQKPQPGVSHIPSSDKNAFTGTLTPRDREDLINRLKTRTATQADMALIDESMIFDLPFIKASDFSIPGQYDPKPKDPNIRFRWVNCVNALQSNMQRFLALGYTMAERDDVDETKTPLNDQMIQGTQIRQYDVVLMKINVLVLMGLYKRNIQDSAYKLDSVTSGRMAEAAAGQAFNDLLGSDPDAINTGARNALGKYRIASGKEPVTFSRT